MFGTVCDDAQVTPAGRRLGGDREQPFGLQLGLVPLPRGVRPPGDASAGTEPQMPPFVAQNVRIPTASSPGVASASTHPIAPQYGPRGAVSSSSMRRNALTTWVLRSPIPAGRSRRGSRPTRRPVAAHPRRWRRGGPSPGALRAAAATDTATEPGARDPSDVVADEVDDHHVLGGVLLEQVSGRASGALDRATTRSRSPSRLRNSSGDALRHLDAWSGSITTPDVRRRVLPASKVGRGRRGRGPRAARQGRGRCSPGRRFRPRWPRGSARPRSMYCARVIDDVHAVARHRRQVAQLRTEAAARTRLDAAEPCRGDLTLVGVAPPPTTRPGRGRPGRG